MRSLWMESHFSLVGWIRVILHLTFFTAFMKKTEKVLYMMSNGSVVRKCKTAPPPFFTRHFLILSRMLGLCWQAKFPIRNEGASTILVGASTAHGRVFQNRAP